MLCFLNTPKKVIRKVKILWKNTMTKEALSPEFKEYAKQILNNVFKEENTIISVVEPKDKTN